MASSVSDNSVLQSYNYKIIKEIGSGTYGEVYKVRHTGTREVYALKKIYLECEDEGIPSTALREACLVKELSRNHRNIVRLEQVIRERMKLFFVYEFCSYDLKKLLDLKKEAMNPLIIQNILHQILDAVDHCHSNRFIHRDLKPQNVLVTSSGTIKLADFGLARSFTLPFTRYTHEVITLWYRCPEILLGIDVYDTSVDLWSVGVIFTELLTHTPVFRGKSEIDQLLKIFRILGTPSAEDWDQIVDLKYYKNVFPKWEAINICEKLPESVTPQAVDLISQMFSYDPTKRPTALEAMQHPYFSDQKTNETIANRLFLELYQNNGNNNSSSWRKS